MREHAELGALVSIFIFHYLELHHERIRNGIIRNLCNINVPWFSKKKIYPDLEYTGYSSVGNCTGQCYVDYVALNGTAVEIEQRKKALAEGDPLAVSVYGQAVAHGPGANGGGGVGPMLAGLVPDDIINKLNLQKQWTDWFASNVGTGGNVNS